MSPLIPGSTSYVLTAAIANAPASSVLNSPLDMFEVSPLLEITGPVLGGLVFGLTNFVLYGVVVIGLVLGLHLLADNESRLIPSHWSVALETVYASVLSFARDQLGTGNEAYVPFAYALFWLVIVTNLVGNVPYGFTLSASLVMSIGLSLTLWIGVTLMAVVRHGLRFWAYFVPAGTPLALVPLLVLIEVTSYCARAVSLGVRLFANLVAGHMLLAILSGFLLTLFTYSLVVSVLTLLPIAVFTALVLLEVAVSVIQAYVFVTLVCSYTHDAIELH